MTRNPLGRRTFLLGTGAVAATTALAACGTGTSRSSSGSSASSSKTLTVRDSGGSYGDANQKILYDGFTKETGIPVKVVNMEYAQMLTQIQTGAPSFDLIDDSMGDFLLFAQKKAVQKLDTTRLSNFKNAGISANLVTDYAIARNTWASVYGYRTDAFGGSKPASWADFWTPSKFTGKRSLQNQDEDVPELEFALLADGVAVDQLSPLDVDRAFKSLTRINSDVLKYWDSGSLPGVLLSRQEVTMSSIWSGRLYSLIQSGVPVAYQWNGARRQSNGYAIPQGSSNTDAAYKLIDYSLRPDVQAAFAKTFPVAPTVPAAYNSLAASVRANLATAPEHKDTGFDLDLEWWYKNTDSVLARWQTWAQHV